MEIIDRTIISDVSLIENKLQLRMDMKYFALSASHQLLQRSNFIFAFINVPFTLPFIKCVTFEFDNYELKNKTEIEKLDLEWGGEGRNSQGFTKYINCPIPKLLEQKNQNFDNNLASL